MKFLKNKNILITGASKGLGALIAKEFSFEDCNLILTASTETKLKKIVSSCKNSKKHKYYVCNFQSKENIIEMTKFVKKNFKKLDIIMHIAGGGLGIKSILPNYDEYIKVFNLNLFSAFEINRELLSLMKKNRRGTIFHVGSIAANESVGSISYNVSKYALNAYVRSLSKELAKFNICVTGINPGGFEYKDNAMFRLRKNNLKAYNNFINKRIPIKRMPNANELMPLIKTLISEKNMMLTGSMISCDSGEGNFYK